MANLRLRLAAHVPATLRWNVGNAGWRRAPRCVAGLHGDPFDISETTLRIRAHVDGGSAQVGGRNIAYVLLLLDGACVGDNVIRCGWRGVPRHGPSARASTALGASASPRGWRRAPRAPSVRAPGTGAASRASCSASPPTTPADTAASAPHPGASTCTSGSPVSPTSTRAACTAAADATARTCTGVSPRSTSDSGGAARRAASASDPARAPVPRGRIDARLSADAAHAAARRSAAPTRAWSAVARAFAVSAEIEGTPRRDHRTAREEQRQPEHLPLVRHPLPLLAPRAQFKATARIPIFKRSVCRLGAESRLSPASGG